MGRNDRSRSARVRLRRHAVSRQRTTDSRLDRRIDPAWLTVSQLCRRWQLGRKTIYKFIDADLLPVWRVGSHLYRVAIQDVVRFEAQHKLPSK
jgi:excisionase family DNA binding protein